MAKKESTKEEIVDTITDKLVQSPADKLVETPQVDEIYIKYDYVLNQFKDGIVRIDYATGMDILRYCERRIGSNIPMNFGCSTCVYDLVKLFNNLKK